MLFRPENDCKRVIADDEVTQPSDDSYMDRRLMILTASIDVVICQRRAVTSHFAKL